MLLVRSEAPRDIAPVRELLSASFPTLAEAALVDALRAAGHLTLSLVAEVDGDVVGHIAFSPVLAEGGHGGLGLAPLAVLEPHRRRGVGARLVAGGLVACSAMGCGWVVVLGDPEYYSRFGFRSAPALGLQDEYGGGDAFQVVELLPGTLPQGAGLVRYSAQFAALG
jgi:putative acetyltransferase